MFRKNGLIGLMGLLRLRWELKSSTLMLTLVFLLFLSINVMVPPSKVQATDYYNLTPYKWGLKPSDVLIYEIQELVGGKDVIEENGFQGPLVVAIRVDNISLSPQYTPEGALLQPVPEASLVEYRLDNLRYLPEAFYEKPLLIHYFSQFPSYLTISIGTATNYLDYQASLYRSGTTETVTQLPIKS